MWLIETKKDVKINKKNSANPKCPFCLYVVGEELGMIQTDKSKANIAQILQWGGFALFVLS